MKKLIYFTFGNNPKFLKLLDLCVKSLNKTNYNGDLLVITDQADAVKKEIKFQHNVHYLEVPPADLEQSSANKFKIYQFEHINDYDKIIYCDLDFLWSGSPDILFDLITEDKIYIAQEPGLLSLGYYNAGLTQEEVDFVAENQVLGFSAGFFGFKSSMIYVFQELDELFKKNTIKAHCLEQPTFVTYLFRKNLFDSAFNNIVIHTGYYFVRNKLKADNVVAVHFSGKVGDFYHKHQLMFEYYLKAILTS